MRQLRPQPDLDSNLDSTDALSPGPGDFTPEPPCPSLQNGDVHGTFWWSEGDGGRSYMQNT